MTKERDNLSGKQHKAVLAIVAGEDAAQAAGVGERTVRRWRRDELFVREVERARAELHREAVDALVRRTADAVATLAELLEKTHPPSVRCRAAVAILQAAREHRQLDEHERRIAELEAKQAEDRNAAT